MLFWSGASGPHLSIAFAFLVQLLSELWRPWQNTGSASHKSSLSWQWFWSHNLCTAQWRTQDVAAAVAPQNQQEYRKTKKIQPARFRKAVKNKQEKNQNNLRYSVFWMRRNPRTVTWLTGCSLLSFLVKHQQQSGCKLQSCIARSGCVQGLW